MHHQKNFQRTSNMATSLELNLTDWVKEQTYIYNLPTGRTLPVRWSDKPLRNAVDTVLIDHPSRIKVLARLEKYPHVQALLDEDTLTYATQRKTQVKELIRSGIYIFGAYKVGLKLARIASDNAVTVHGFLDNDPEKHGCSLAGIPIQHPAEASLANATVLIASGRHSNAIYAQLNQTPAQPQLVNMHEFLYALNGPHGPETFDQIVEAPTRDPYRFISAFLRLDDEPSRRVFDALIGMRTGLSISLAEHSKSPYEEEYFEKDFVSPSQAKHFVDAGAAAGDTLLRLEKHFGAVEQAWLFEPELPIYYEALKNFSSRPEIWLFNMGLDEKPSRAVYQPALSYDIAGEIQNNIPNNITSYIQGVRMDDVVLGKVSLFKLDIEGMEGSALRGAKKIILRDKPTLAVCAYHRADDYWKLMDDVLSIRSDYRVGIRLYADILEDITLYFF